jgi:CHAT domain-containing protein
MIPARPDRFILILILSILMLEPSFSRVPEYKYYNTNLDQSGSESGNMVVYEIPDKDLGELNTRLLNALTINDTAKSREIVLHIRNRFRTNSDGDLLTSNSQYLIGVYYLITDKSSEALNWFRLASSIREKLSIEDEIFAKCLFNIGIAYFNVGDYRRMAQSLLRALEVEKRIYGDNDPRMISSLSALVTAYLKLNDYSKAVDYGNTAFSLAGKAKAEQMPVVAVLYTNIGVCYTWLSDYSKARLYYEQAEEIYRKYSLPEDANYINLLNCLGAVYYFLGMDGKSEDYFNKGFQKIKTSRSAISMNLLNSFAIILGNAGRTEIGNRILLNTLEKARSFYGEDSKNYIEVLKNYADYLLVYRLDMKKSLDLYKFCAGYVDANGEDLQFRNSVLLGYAVALNDNQYSADALEILQGLLFSNQDKQRDIPELDDPVVDQMEPGHWSIGLLRAKYRTLRNIYSETHDNKYLFAASRTAENVISLIERARISISEEDSRIILGDRFRDSYLFALSDFELCYKITENPDYLIKAFEYSEKSKVAGLLASTRELKATQFHIPAAIADLEWKLKSEISFYEARIAEVNAGSNSDETMLSEWKTMVLNSTQRRDSLVRFLEKQYPDYYSIKYNTKVIDPDNIPSIAGRDVNYISYVASDSVIYIFLKNRKFLQLAAIQVDPEFYKKVSEFRNLLSYPVNDARSDFSRFMNAGTILYEKLIKPVEPYFVSDRLMISPDNIISYIPFEAIPDGTISNSYQFKDIQYLMRRYRISYTYSATYLAESFARRPGFRNNLVAFAPVYTGSINIDSLMGSRQAGISTLYDLPYARTEARFVTDMTGGKLYSNTAARESLFKSEAGKYDIIHLSMHTILNDQDPMYSKMLFYQEKDSLDDGNLNTWEVYGIPLRAKMVILSSCNTGNGQLHSGEGILSLARGFMYSGSQSVVMSIWEIEDKSGTEIVREFYKYLRRGGTKSDALRKARLNYLKDADMLRSHPYFWSSLVIYGNDDSLYPDRKLMIPGLALLILIVASSVFYFFRPK